MLVYCFRCHDFLLHAISFRLKGELGRIISPAALRVLIGKKSDPYEYLKLLILEIVFGSISITFSDDFIDVNHLGHFGRLPKGSRS